jgi:hypothetical protein
MIEAWAAINWMDAHSGDPCHYAAPSSGPFGYQVQFRSKSQGNLRDAAIQNAPIFQIPSHMSNAYKDWLVRAVTKKPRVAPGFGMSLVMR